MPGAESSLKRDGVWNTDQSDVERIHAKKLLAK